MLIPMSKRLSEPQEEPAARSKWATADLFLLPLFEFRLEVHGMHRANFQPAPGVKGINLPVFRGLQICAG